MKWISWIFTVTNCNCKVVVNWENESGSLGLLKRAMTKVSKYEPVVLNKILEQFYATVHKGARSHNFRQFHHWSSGHRILCTTHLCILEAYFALVVSLQSEMSWSWCQRTPPNLTYNQLVMLSRNSPLPVFLWWICFTTRSSRGFLVFF